MRHLVQRDMHQAFSLSMAEICDAKAEDAGTDGDRDEWQLMAEEWRHTAVLDSLHTEVTVR